MRSATEECGFSLIVAVAQNMGIGCNGKLPWRLKGDMAYFKALTTSFSVPKLKADQKNLVLMGRKTWDSIPARFRPLSNRINVVVSRNLEFTTQLEASHNDDVVACNDLDKFLSELSNLKALNEAWGAVWVIGGAEIYAECLKHPGCNRVFLTRVEDDGRSCDAYFPYLCKDQWKLLDSSETLALLQSNDSIPGDIYAHPMSENGIKYTYNIYERIA